MPPISCRRFQPAHFRQSHCCRHIFRRQLIAFWLSFAAAIDAAATAAAS